MSSRHKPSCCRAKMILPTATRRSRSISSVFIAPSVADGRSPMSSMVQMALQSGRSHKDAIDPDVWSGRALQVDFAELAVSGLASMYPVSDWSCFAPDHHGYQRACDLVNGQASTGHLGHQCAHALGRPNLHLVSSSRRPRLETVDRVTSSLSPHIAQFLCSSQGPFLRPGPQNVDRDARRGGQGRPSRLACGWLKRVYAR